MIKDITWFLVLTIILLSGCDGQHPALITPSQIPTKQVPVAPTSARIATDTTLSPTFVLTPTFDFSNYPSAWIRFDAPVYKVSFEYPSIYNEAPFQEECAPYDGYDGIVISSHSKIMVRSLDGLAVNEFIPAFIEQYWSARPVEIIAEIPSQAGSYPAQQVDYQFTNTNITGTFTFVSQEETVYIFSFTSEASCDIVPLNLREWDAYQRAIQTFGILP